jgi:hypothetical protein
VTKANLKATVGFVTFTVTGVTHPTDSYNWADNHDHNHDPIGEQPNVTVLAP